MFQTDWNDLVESMKLFDSFIKSWTPPTIHEFAYAFSNWRYREVEDTLWLSMAIEDDYNLFLKYYKEARKVIEKEEKEAKKEEEKQTKKVESTRSILCRIEDIVIAYKKFNSDEFDINDLAKLTEEEQETIITSILETESELLKDETINALVDYIKTQSRIRLLAEKREKSAKTFLNFIMRNRGLDEFEAMNGKIKKSLSPKYEVVDEAKVPNEYLMVCDAKIRSFYSNNTGNIPWVVFNTFFDSYRVY